MDKNKNKNKTLIPKIICLLLSFGLWIYVSNVENPVRTYELRKVPVELINLDSLEDLKLAISDNQKFTVDLKLEGSSAEITKVKPEDFKLEADLSSYALKLGENTVPIKIIDCPENISIQNSSFLAIKVNLEKLISKDLSIQSKVKLNFKDNIYETSKDISPNKVTVTGAESTIGRINSAIIEGEEKDISSSFEKSYDIKFIDSKGAEVEGISSNVSSAKLSVGVSHGKSVPINFKMTGTVKNGLELKGYELSSNYINIIGNADTLSKVQSIDTETVDISKLEDSTELDVKLIIPDNISVKDGQKSIKVKFTISSSNQATADNAISKTLEIPVKYNGLRDNLDVQLKSNKVSVTITGPQSEINKITETSLEATINLSDVSGEGSYSYTPEVTFTSPSTATISSIGNVEADIKEKE